MRIKIHVWRQSNRTDRGEMKSYDMDGLSPDMSFLEMMDQLNEQLIENNEEPVAFDHDCREGVCGACSMVINGEATTPGPNQNRTRFRSSPGLRKRLWMQPAASAVERASQPVLTDPPCYSPPPNRLT